MDERAIATPDHVPVGWTVAAAPSVCSCREPLPQVRAVRKGAARTYCARCGRPVRIDFPRRR
jgi:hypothetical protein